MSVILKVNIIFFKIFESFSEIEKFNAKQKISLYFKDFKFFLLKNFFLQLWTRIILNGLDNIRDYIAF